MRKLSFHEIIVHCFGWPSIHEYLILQHDTSTHVARPAINLNWLFIENIEIIRSTLQSIDNVQRKYFFYLCNLPSDAISAMQVCSVHSRENINLCQMRHNRKKALLTIILHWSVLDNECRLGMWPDCSVGC